MGVALTLVLAAGCTGDDSGRQLPPATPPRAKLSQLSGDVKVKRAAGDDWVSATEQMDLFENDKVHTALGASATLTFTSGQVLNLSENSLLAIAETHPRPGLDRTDVTLLRGRADAELKDADRQSLSITTPAATVRAGREIVFQ